MKRYNIFVEQNGHKWQIDETDCQETAEHLADMFYSHIYDKVTVVDNDLVRT